MTASRCQRTRKQKRQIWSGGRCFEPACPSLTTPGAAAKFERQHTAGVKHAQGGAEQSRQGFSRCYLACLPMSCHAQQRATACSAYRYSCALTGVQHHSGVENLDCPLCRARDAPSVVSADRWRHLTWQRAPRQVCDRLQERRADLAPFIDEDFEAYVAAMRHPHTWGGEPELSVAADVLSRPVHVRPLL